MTNQANKDLSRCLGELLGLPLQGMTRIVVTAEVRKAPTVDVSYLVVGPRAVTLGETHREQRSTRHLAIREQYRLVPKGSSDDAPAFAPGPAAADQVQRFEQAQPGPPCVNLEASKG